MAKGPKQGTIRDKPSKTSMPLPKERAQPQEAADPVTTPAHPPSILDPLGETIAYRPGLELPEDYDGFPEVDDLTGRMLGQYRIGPVIGRGAMGRVYRGEHAGLGRTSAIKVFDPGLLTRQPQLLENFWAEARALAGLTHPHIVSVYNIGSDRGYHFIEMELVPGGVSLKERLVRDGALEPVYATTLIRQVVEALGAAHRANLVHRDVKPANVLLTPEGHAKLADFGLVRHLTAEELTIGPVAGTPTFMAPELFQGAPSSPSSDFYAVGVMYYYLLSARLPFASDHLTHLIELHRRAPVPDIRQHVPSLPAAVAEIITRCLAKRPEARFDSAEDLADELQGIVSELRDLAALVREALEGVRGVLEEHDPEHFRVLLKVPGGRLQEVHLEISRGRHNRKLLSVYSVCCPADPRHYEFALKLNAELTYGGLSVRVVDGQPMFVMARNYPGGDLSPNEIRAAVLEIARRGDWVERQLTKLDQY
jgi:hypothetical protein